MHLQELGGHDSRIFSWLCPLIPSPLLESWICFCLRGNLDDGMLNDGMLNDNNIIKRMEFSRAAVCEADENSWSW